MAEGAALELESVLPDLHLHAALQDEHEVAGGSVGAVETEVLSLGLLQHDAADDVLPEQPLENVLGDVVGVERFYTWIFLFWRRCRAMS